MPNRDGEVRKVPPLLIVLAIVLVLAGLADWEYRAAVAHTVETLYVGIFAAAPARPESFPTEAGRLERCERLLAMWRSIDTPTIDLAQVQVALPLPLRLTRTLRVDNPEVLRKRAGEIFARDLAALSGRQGTSTTVSAWAYEIEKWRAGIKR